MQYKVTFSCGHEGFVRISGGKASEREWKANKMAEHECAECQKRRRESMIKEENKKSQEASKDHSFPALEGSEKQIAWANTIRMKFYDFCKANGFSADKIIAKETTAKFWIDNRFDVNSKEFAEEHAESGENEEKDNALSYNEDDDSFELVFNNQENRIKEKLMAFENVKLISDNHAIVNTRKLNRMKNLAFSCCFIADEAAMKKLNIKKEDK